MQPSKHPPLSPDLCYFPTLLQQLPPTFLAHGQAIPHAFPPSLPTLTVCRHLCGGVAFALTSVPVCQLCLCCVTDKLACGKLPCPFCLPFLTPTTPPQACDLPHPCQAAQWLSNTLCGGFIYCVWQQPHQCQPPPCAPKQTTCLPVCGWLPSPSPRLDRHPYGLCSMGL